VEDIGGRVRDLDNGEFLEIGTNEIIGKSKI
jgi:hypothetical protein